MTARRELPRPLRDEPFGSAIARSRGVTANCLRAHDLTRAHRGARAHSAPGSVQERAAAYRPLLGKAQCFSHTTAAQLYGIPLPARLERVPDLHVAGIGTEHRPRRPGVIGHRLGRGEIFVLRRDAVLDPASTWISLASMLSTDELIVAGDALVGHLRLVTEGELRSAVEHAGRVRGIRSLRAALDEIRPGSRSPGETRLRLVLTRHGLPEPARNHDVVADGRWIACVDLAYPEQRVAIEYDSDLHRTDPVAYRKDLTRSERLKDVGWWPVRATAFDVEAGADEFVSRIRRLLVVGSAGPHRP